MIILRTDIVEERLKGYQTSRCIHEATAAAADLLT